MNYIDDLIERVLAEIRKLTGRRFGGEFIGLQLC
jgi:hypothetical protein